MVKQSVSRWYLTLVSLTLWTRWHWLIGTCKFQMYTSMMCGLFIALCVHNLKSRHPPSPFIWPPLSITILCPFPPVVTIPLSMFIFYVCIPHISEIIWSSAFSELNLFLCNLDAFYYLFLTTYSFLELLVHCLTALVKKSSYSYLVLFLRDNTFRLSLLNRILPVLFHKCASVPEVVFYCLMNRVWGRLLELWKVLWAV